MVIKAVTQDLIEEFFRLVRIDSDTLDCTKMVAYLVNMFKIYLNTDALEQKTGQSSNLVFKMGEPQGNGADHPPLLIAAHMDTVTPGKGVRPLLKEDRVVSSGDTILGADNKTAIALFVYGLRLAQENRLKVRPLEIVFTYAEEMGLLGANKFDYSLISAKEGFCFDSDGDIGGITVSAPNYMRFELEVLGRSAHSGIAPEKGINAIAALSSIISKLKWGRLNSRLTTNIGTIEGGRANNIVPDRAVITGEIRSPDLARIRERLKAMKKVCSAQCKRSRAKYKLNIFKEFDGYGIGPSEPLLVNMTRLMKDLGIRPKIEKSNGGSDANIFNAHGIRTLNLAVGMENVHTTKEFVKVRNLQQALRLFLNMVSYERVEVEFT
jgi:tripeptide aminopeptidase